MNVKTATSRLIRLMTTPPQIGGLEITDSGLRFLGIKRDGFLKASLRLPPGIIESGKVKEGQKTNLVEAFKNLHSQLSANSKKIINVFFSLPSSNVYIQSFNVSMVAEENLAEAADLNLRMLSPIPIETSYFSWQRIGESETGGGTIELLGAFAVAANVDDIIFALRDAGFGVAAVEFASLSLVRWLNDLKAIDRNLSYLIINMTTEGLDFIVVRKGNLYFDYFYPWSLIQGDSRNISLDSLKEVMEAEVTKVLNFYLGHWGGQIKNVLVVAPSIHEEIKNILNKKFSYLTVEAMNTLGTAVAHGAALRGKLPRGEDTDISLTSETAANIFGEEQILRFVSIWRNALFAVAGFILLIFALTNVYLIKAARDMAGKSDTSTIYQSEVLELKQLESKAGNFNRLVELVSVAKNLKRDISPFLINLNDLAGRKISFDRIYLQALDRPVDISGSASSEDAILEFKQQLESQFSDVNLPLSSIVMKSNGQLAFTVSFIIKNLIFPVSTPEEEIQKQKDDKQKEAIIEQELMSIAEILKNGRQGVTDPLIIFRRFEFKSVSDPVILEVSAIDEETANLFKSKLEESEIFYNTRIVSGFTKTEDERISFQMKFSVSL